MAKAKTNGKREPKKQVKAGRMNKEEEKKKKVRKSKGVVEDKKSKVGRKSTNEKTSSIDKAKRLTLNSKIAKSKKRLKVAFVSPEALPLVKVGGLADVVGSLSVALSRLGVESIVVLPEYRTIREGNWEIKDTGIRISSPVGPDWLEAGIDLVEIGPIKYYLVRYDPFFDREGIYGEGVDYPDNLERFSFFSKVVLELFKRIGFTPDIIHCNDWQTGLIPVFLRAFYGSDPFYSKTKIVFGLHNLAYQGLFPVEKFYLLGLDWAYFTYQGVEFYGKVNCLKAALIYSDAIVVVSPRYAQEIQTPEYGWGLDGVLRSQRDKLYGILNGIDYDYWNPWTDEFIYEKFGVRGGRVFLKGKLVNKTRLLEEESLEVDPKTMVIGLISRLVHQKGIDIAVDGIRKALSKGFKDKIYLIALGKGDKEYEESLLNLAKEFPNNVRVHLEFNEPLAHRIYAGVDVILIPSRFEPCGLTQMIAMRYGSIPLVRRTGGLIDTVSEEIGFLFDKPEGDELLSTIERTFHVFGDQKEWQKRVKKSMKQDFSWDRNANAYKKLYERLKRRK